MSHYRKDGPWELPEGWVWTTLGSVCSIKGGKRIPKGKTFSKDKTAHVYIRVTDMKNGSVDMADLKYIDEDVYEEIRRYTIEKDDLYLTIAGTIGKVGEIPDALHGMNLTENAARLTEIVCDKRYLMYSLMTDLAQNHFSLRFHQVAQPKLSIETSSSTLIAMPPLAEQKRIVRAIENIFNCFRLLDLNLAALEGDVINAKKLILDLAIHGKLVPQDPADEPASELLRRINPAFKPSDNLHYVGELPKGWQLCHIQDIAKVELGKTLDRIKNSGSEVPYLCALNVKWDGIDLSTLKTLRLEDSEKNRYRLLPNDLLVCEGGDVGRCAIWRESVEMYYQNALHRVRFYDRILPEFFLFVLRFYKNAGVIDDICKGVTIKHFTGQVFRTLDLPFPPINEQKRIVDKVNCLFNSIDLIADMINAS